MSFIPETRQRTHIDAFLLQQHLPFDIFVVCTFLPPVFWFGVDAIDLVLGHAVIYHQQELVGDFLLDLDGLIVTYVSEGCFLQR